MNDAARIRVVSAEAFERETPFRFAFRFGVAEVTRAPQAFVRVEIADEAGRRATGWAAEMMMPKWFDKDPALTPEDNIGQLRTSLAMALKRITTLPADSAFGLHVAAEAEHHRTCAEKGMGGLIASYGLALADRAVIDALGRLEGISAAQLVRDNRLGIDARTAPDLADFSIDDFLSRLSMPETIGIRHTVGLGDALTADDLTTPRLNDGLPETLEEVIAAYGHTYFKLKIGGNPEADCARLKRIAGVLERLAPDYRATLDGNEQYRDEDHVLELFARIDADPAMATLRRRILFLEQPIARATALSQPVEKLAALLPVEIDESDGDMDAFVTAKALGYSGISSKSCKGFYRSLLNAARVAKWNAESGARRFFISGEDLTTQAGIAVQQDLVLAALAGVTHVERNGHHFVDGMAGAPEAEQDAFLAAHGDLYTKRLGRARLDITGGAVSLRSISAAAGLGAAVEPHWDTMKRLGETG